MSVCGWLWVVMFRTLIPTTTSQFPYLPFLRSPLELLIHQLARQPLFSAPMSDEWRYTRAAFTKVLLLRSDSQAEVRLRGSKVRDQTEVRLRPEWSQSEGELRSEVRLRSNFGPSEVGLRSDCTPKWKVQKNSAVFFLNQQTLLIFVNKQSWVESLSRRSFVIWHEDEFESPLELLRFSPDWIRTT